MLSMFSFGLGSYITLVLVTEPVYADYSQYPDIVEVGVSTRHATVTSLYPPLCCRRSPAASSPGSTEAASRCWMVRGRESSSCSMTKRIRMMKNQCPRDLMKPIQTRLNMLM